MATSATTSAGAGQPSRGTLDGRGSVEGCSSMASLHEADERLWSDHPLPSAHGEAPLPLAMLVSTLPPGADATVPVTDRSMQLCVGDLHCYGWRLVRGASDFVHTPVGRLPIVPLPRESDLICVDVSTATPGGPPVHVAGAAVLFGVHALACVLRMGCMCVWDACAQHVHGQCQSFELADEFVVATVYRYLFSIPALLLIAHKLRIDWTEWHEHRRLPTPMLRWQGKLEFAVLIGALMAFFITAWLPKLTIPDQDCEYSGGTTGHQPVVSLQTADIVMVSLWVLLMALELSQALMHAVGAAIRHRDARLLLELTDLQVDAARPLA